VLRGRRDDTHHVIAHFFLAPGWTGRNRWRAVCLASDARVLSSCGGSGGGGGSNPHGTPAGAYQLKVKALSGSTTQSITLTLTVQ
jgi:hypothetical protein